MKRDAQICFEKFAIASAVDAFYRKKAKFLQLEEKIKIAESILGNFLIYLNKIITSNKIFS